MTDTITVQGPYIGMDDAMLSVEADEYGDSYTMTLTAADGHIIASASGFRPGASQDFGTEHVAHTVGTFCGFLSAALEDYEFAAKWNVIGDDASDWIHAPLIMEGEQS